MEDELNYPEDLRYNESHEWARCEDHTVTVGISDHAQAELQNVVYVELPEVGEQIEKGAAFGTVEAVKTVADLIAPTTGEVLEINENLETGAEEINKDAYGAGWMLKIRIEDPQDLDYLLNAQDYAELLANH